MLPSACLTLQETLAILVDLQLHDLTIAWVDWRWYDLPVDLLLCHLLYVNAPLFPVDSEDLATLALELSTHHLHLIALANWHSAHAVLIAKVCAEMGRHELSALVGGSLEVSTAIFGAGAGDVLIVLHPRINGAHSPKNYQNFFQLYYIKN